MRIGRLARLWTLTAAPVAVCFLAGILAGCGDFWQPPGGGGNSTSFTLSNSGAITVSPGASGASTITVTPANSFTGTVTLTCAVTTSPSGAANLPTCSLSPTSVTISSTTAQTSTLTAATSASTTTGAYQITVTGVSGSVAQTTAVCVEVGSSSGSCNGTTATSGDFYILNAGTPPTIVGESIVSGTLTPIPGSPWTVTGTPYSIAIAPNGSFLCVSTTSGVFAYPISNGKLGTAVQVTQDQAYAIQVDWSDSWLLEAIPAAAGVTFAAVPISSTTGAYLSGSTVPTASFAVTSPAVQPNRMVISGDDSNVFLALGAGGTIVVPFSASAPFPSGTKASTIPTVNSNGSALSVAVDPGKSPNLFYIGETLANSAGNSGGLRAFTYSSLGSAKLIQATGSPIASGGLAPNFILPIAAGGYVYVANGAGPSTAGIVAGFAVTASSISAGPTVSAGVQPLGLAEDSNSNFVLAVGSLGSPYFDAYTFDATTTGQLDSQITSTTAAGSIAIAAAP
ncbi:MAG: hypothetical protein ABR924_21160 [Terracidiphilus sp.]|jgi:hypothetical protein